VAATKVFPSLAKRTGTFFRPTGRGTDPGPARARCFKAELALHVEFPARYLNVGHTRAKVASVSRSLRVILEQHDDCVAGAENILLRKTPKIDYSPVNNHAVILI